MHPRCLATRWNSRNRCARLFAEERAVNRPIGPTTEETVSQYQALKASILALPLFCFAASSGQAQQPAPGAARDLKPVTSEMLRNPPAADWLMWRRSYDG